MNRILLLLVFCGHSFAADRKPNFRFIYTDDQRWDAMGVVQHEQGERACFQCSNQSPTTISTRTPRNLSISTNLKHK